MRGAELRLVICHLGHGCSVTAVHGGKSVDTSMGFTPLDGLAMATRSGSVDPGILLHVLRERGLNAEQLETVLNRESGLAGLSGQSGDMRQILEAAAAGQARAALALAVYVHRLRQTIGAMAVTLGGVDALIFTAGVGENAAPVRALACEGLACLGLVLDPALNDKAKPDTDIATAASSGRILVIHTREDLVILRETRRLILERTNP